MGSYLPCPAGVLEIDTGSAAALAALAASLWCNELAPTAEEAKKGGAFRHQCSGFLSLGVLAFGLVHLAHYSGGIQMETRADDSLVASARRLFSLAPGSALGFTLTGLSLLLLDARTRFLRLVSTGTALGAGMTSLLVVLGHLFHALAFQDVRSFSPMMPGTALTVIALVGGILWSRPHREPVITLTSVSAGGVTARRLLAAVVVLPVIGWLRLLGQEWGLYGTNTGIALYCASTMFVFGVLVWWNARRLRYVDAEKQHAEGALRDSESRYRLLFANSPLPMWIYDAETLRFLAVNDAAIAHYGFTRDEFLALTIVDICPAEDAEKVRTGETQWRHRRKDGTLISVEITSIDATFATEGKPSRLVLAHDVTVREEAAAQVQAYSRALERQKRDLQIANERLKALATRDGLTGLFNHRVFYEHLSVAYEGADRYHHPLTLLLIDVDHFKSYNDEFGHPAGDYVLQTVAEVLEGEARRSDVVARYGGEEFAVLLPHTEADKAMVVAERLRVAIEGYPWLKRPITVSIGVAAVGEGIADSAALVRAADDALYLSKRQGRNRVSRAALRETPVMVGEKIARVAAVR